MSENADSSNDINDLRLEPIETCPNCGAKALGEWCYRCGQNQRSIHRFFLEVVGEALEDVFSLNSRTARTFFGLLFRPGFIANEFFDGRRARYLPPVRVFLITSFVFFFLLSVQNMLGETTTTQDDPANEDLTEQLQEAGVDAQTSEETVELVEGLRELREEEATLDLPWLSPELNEQLEARLNQQLDKARAMVREDPGDALDAVLEVVPPAIFVLLPIFALLLKIFYFSFGFYYVEHLVLAVNNHSFLFTILTIETMLGWLPAGEVADTLTTVIFTWIPIYMFLSLRRVYMQGWFATFINFMLLGLCYVILLATVTVAALFVGLFTL